MNDLLLLYLPCLNPGAQDPTVVTGRNKVFAAPASVLTPLEEICVSCLTRDLLLDLSTALSSRNTSPRVPQ